MGPGKVPTVCGGPSTQQHLHSHAGGQAKSRTRITLVNEPSIINACMVVLAR